MTPETIMILGSLLIAVAGAAMLGRHWTIQARKRDRIGEAMAEIDANKEQRALAAYAMLRDDPLSAARIDREPSVMLYIAIELGKIKIAVGNGGRTYDMTGETRAALLRLPEAFPVPTDRHGLAEIIGRYEKPLSATLRAAARHRGDDLDSKADAALRIYHERIARAGNPGERAIDAVLTHLEAMKTGPLPHLVREQKKLGLWRTSA